MRGTAADSEMRNVRKHLRTDEARRLIDAAGKIGRHRFRDKVLVRLCFRHGLRASEAVTTRWEQLDLDAGTYFIRRAKNGISGTHSLDRDELRDLRTLKDKASGPWVFETERGGPMTVDLLQIIVKRAGELAGLEVSAHPHMLRHAAGFQLANDGTDVRLIQQHLGHRNIQNTVVYTALVPGRLASARVR